MKHAPQHVFNFTVRLIRNLQEMPLLQGGVDSALETPEIQSHDRKYIDVSLRDRARSRAHI